MSKSSSVKVCIRMRPLLQHEDAEFWQVNESTSTIFTANAYDNHTDLLSDSYSLSNLPNRDIKRALMDSIYSPQSFTFDKVYDVEANSQMIYKEICRDLTKSVINGFNSSIFMYGQTTSGKTFTMLGSPNSPGILPCALRDVFNMISKEENRDSFNVYCSYIEIYNENIHDLLTDANFLKLIDDNKYGVVVAGAKRVKINNFEDGVGIKDYGEEHIKTGALIVYTSADSVLQIAAHEDDVPVEQLYEYCRMARRIMQGEHGVGRVIARPYVGTWPNYTRTPRRHDFSLDPTGDTVLDALTRKGLATIGVGKISDIFAGRSVSRTLGINKDNRDGMEKTLALQDEEFTGLAFVNLVDFDMAYGHRRDIEGYARAATEFDAQLGTFLSRMREDDVLMITADHGCDPGAPGTDHTREYVPLLVYGKRIKENNNLGTYPTFAMIGATVADMFDAELKTKGESLLPRLLR